MILRLDSRSDAAASSRAGVGGTTAAAAGLAAARSRDTAQRTGQNDSRPAPVSSALLPRASALSA